MAGRIPIRLAALALALGVGCAARAATVTIPFDPARGLVAVQATAGPQPLTLLLDSALDPSAIDVAAASALALRPQGPSEPVEGVGAERVEAYGSTLPHLVVGGQAFTDVEVAVIDLSRIRARYGAPLHGILGYSFLKRTAVVVDYPANTLTLGSGADLRRQVAACRRAWEAPLRFLADDDRLILVPGFRIDGAAVKAILDTGSSHGLRIQQDAASLQSIRGRLIPGAPSTSVGARGEAAFNEGAVRGRVTLGPFSVENPAAALVATYRPEAPVTVGSPLLRQMGLRLLLDIPGRRLGFYGDCGRSPAT